MPRLSNLPQTIFSKCSAPAAVTSAGSRDAYQRGFWFLDRSGRTPTEVIFRQAPCLPSVTASSPPLVGAFSAFPNRQYHNSRPSYPLAFSRVYPEHLSPFLKALVCLLSSGVTVPLPFTFGEYLLMQFFYPGRGNSVRVLKPHLRVAQSPVCPLFLLSRARRDFCEKFSLWPPNLSC